MWCLLSGTSQADGVSLSQCAQAGQGMGEQVARLRQSSFRALLRYCIGAPGFLYKLPQSGSLTYELVLSQFWRLKVQN